jgi:hypothetical protein
MMAALSSHAQVAIAGASILAPAAAPSSSGSLKMACCQATVMASAPKPVLRATAPQGFIAPARENQLTSLALDNLFRPPRA